MSNFKEQLEEAWLYLESNHDSVELLFTDKNRPSSEIYKTLLAYFVIRKMQNQSSSLVFSMSIKDISEKDTKAFDHIKLWFDLYAPEIPKTQNAYKQLKNYVHPMQNKYAIDFKDTAILDTTPLGFNYELIDSVIQLSTGITIGKISTGFVSASPGKRFDVTKDEALANLCLMSGNMDAFKLLKPKKSIRKHLRTNASNIFNLSKSSSIKENILRMYFDLANQKVEESKYNSLKLCIELGLTLEDLVTNLKLSKILENDEVYNSDIDYI